jgi:hypothetical protein
MKTIFSSIIYLSVFISCNKELNTQQIKANTTSSLPSADTILINDSTIFFDVVIGGQRQLQIQPLNNYGVYWTGVVPYTSGSYGLYEQGITNGNYGMVLIRGNIALEGSDTSVLLKNQRMFGGFQPGSYSYTQNPNNSSGVQLHWTDSTGKTWGTDFGVANQSNRAFHIINRANLNTAYNTIGVTHGIYIRCVFNCILYDNTGKTIELKNGRMGVSVWL